MYLHMDFNHIEFKQFKIIKFEALKETDEIIKNKNVVFAIVTRIICSTIP